jgi:hypothetical protein
MLIHNLKLQFKKSEGETIFFQTENGMEIILPTKLLSNYQDHQQALYLNLDTQTITDVEDSRKELLNELLGDNEEITLS